MKKIFLGEFKGWQLYADKNYYFIENNTTKCAINHNQVVYGELATVYSELKIRLTEKIKQAKQNKN
jgi:hypothetical protein